MPYLHQLVEEMGDRVTSVMVYGAEAHAQNEWPIGSEIQYDQPTTLEERLKIAKEFISTYDLQIPLVLDSCPENEFHELYAAWPVRFYVISKGKMVYIAEPIEGSFLLSEVYDVLRSLLA